jgi:hypothetical protein
MISNLRRPAQVFKDILKRNIVAGLRKKFRITDGVLEMNLRVKFRADSVQVMNPTNQREAEVFCDALNVLDPVQRQRFLEQACGGDAGFRAQIESLLAVQPEAERFFDRVALALEMEASPPAYRA